MTMAVVGVQVKLWHVHWVVDGGCNVDSVTHEEEYVLEVFHG